jgi:hypothetical protein
MKSRWEAAVWKDVIDLFPGAELEGESKGERILEEGGLGGHVPKTGQSAMEEEEKEAGEGEEYYHIRVEHLLSFYIA